MRARRTMYERAIVLAGLLHVNARRNRSLGRREVHLNRNVGLRCGLERLDERQQGIWLQETPSVSKCSGRCTVCTCGQRARVCIAILWLFPGM